jgi:hypothetical protein
MPIILIESNQEMKKKNCQVIENKYEYENSALFYLNIK